MQEETIRWCKERGGIVKSQHGPFKQLSGPGPYPLVRAHQIPLCGARIFSCNELAIAIASG